MLGKRCRTIQRTASISQNMGPHCLHHHNHHQLHDVTSTAKANHAEMTVITHTHSANPQVIPGTIIPQIIGFNPMIKSANHTGGGDQNPPLSSDSAPLPPNMPVWLHPHDVYDDDPKYVNRCTAGAPPSTKRSQITPRSALQTLLAAARQITSFADQSAIKSDEAGKSSFQANSTSPSCANSTINAVKQGSIIWQGRTLSEATSKELSSIKQYTTPKASMLITQTRETHDQYSQNGSLNEAPQEHHDDVQMNEVDSENIFDVEGTSNNLGTAGHQISLEATQDRHALYLATSPLTADFTPNLAASMSFLESCHLCRRPLGQGHDIFMYRGENAFCSMECRDKQMRLEERKEKLSYMHSQINKLNVQKQDLLYSNGGIGNTNTTSHYQPHKHPHHHQQYTSQAVAYNVKKQQHRTSLLMPAA